MSTTKYEWIIIPKPWPNRKATRFHRSIKTAAILLPLLLLLTTRIRAQSALDGFDPNANDKIRVVVVQPDGKILIGGDFTTLSPNGGGPVTRNNIARLNPDGTLDTAFDPNGNGLVYAIAVQADGSILVGGTFTTIGGQTRNRIARLNGTTGSAESFNPNADGAVLSLALAADGSVLVGGAFANIGGQERNNMARLSASTGLADSFNPAANSGVTAIAVQPGGKILAGGIFTNIGGQARHRIARLDAVTGLADSFDPNPGDIDDVSAINTIVLQADGKILVGGQFAGIGGQARNRIARLDATTGLADSFNPNPDGFGINSIAVQADGKILVAGNFFTIGGQPRLSIARLDPVTGLADSLDPNPNGFEGFSLAVQADGKILVVGFFFSIGGQARNNIARLEKDGRLDQTLNLNLMTDNSNVTALAVQPDGRVLIGGGFTSVLGVSRNNIARLNTDGTLDMDFNPNTPGFIYSIAVQSDGHILVGGNFENIGGQPRNNIARLDPSTGLADSFNPNAGPTVLAIAVQQDGMILVGGTFAGANSIGGQSRNFIARLDPTTGLADSFDPNANAQVYSLAVQRDGKVLVGGTFNDSTGPITIGGATRNFIARLDPITGLADSFNPAPNNYVYTIALQADGKLLSGGYFDTMGGQTRSHIGRVDPLTNSADSFNPNIVGSIISTVSSIVFQANGQVFAAGLFHTIGGAERRGLARLDANNGLADSFDPNPPDFTAFRSLATQMDGKILASGTFSSIDGQPRNNFARLTNNIAAWQNLAVTSTAVTWALGGSSPQFTRVTFEHSNDGVNYTPLGDGMPTGSDWVLRGLSLPTEQNIYIRARGFYRTGYGNGSESIAESVRNAFVARPSSLGNIATRVRVQAGDNAMIGGFIITGTQPKTVVVRGMGPSLPVPGPLADPVIEVYDSKGILRAENDNWNDAESRQQIIDSGLAPSNDLESALWGVISPGAYTVVVRGANNGSGVGLFEVYDLDQTVDSRLANISTRGVVETGNNVMIGGTIIVGTDPARVLLRAIGPSLTDFGVANALADPILELHDGDGAILASNDNWRTSQETEIIATGIPPSNDMESAIVRDVAPGNYTAIVRGVNNTTGVALVEVYELH